MSSQRRKAFTIEEKGAIICRLENGESNSCLAKEFGEKANGFAARFGVLDFNCSASWISRFKVRHNIVAGKIVGESSSVDQNSTTNWLISAEFTKTIF
ncbi:uncharacterized protein LOC126758709 [Bactrocera neohumeralis]|uniref:uncharacterized protein LOC126758709 n=1 Tax=Bactrocera neohumeralis TaxID=98809 RepID=UPI002165D7DA|nr:uncharacterized protein LOC126758709 [Bactrocera neohumeralis]